MESKNDNYCGYRDLIAWRKAYELCLDLYKCSESWPRSEIYGLTSQARRAAVSVSANIAEGYDRSARKEYAHFLSIARGSLAELETLLLLAKDLGYLAPTDAKRLMGLQQATGKLLHGLLRSTKVDAPPAK
jgi:four helix bundle protein